MHTHMDGYNPHNTPQKLHRLRTNTHTEQYLHITHSAAHTPGKTHTYTEKDSLSPFTYTYTSMQTHTLHPHKSNNKK